MWSTADIAGKPADVFDPPGTPPRFGLLFLHSAGQETLRDAPAYTRLLEQHGVACICPHGQLSWWSDRAYPAFDPQVTAERHVLDRVVPFFRERWGLAQPPALGLCGISMGGQGALRLAFKHPQVFPVVAAVSASVDCHERYDQGLGLEEMYDSKEQCRQDTATLHIHPSQFPPHIFFVIDPDDTTWYRGNDRLHEKLTALGIPHTCDLTTKAGGHSWEYFNHMAGPAFRFLVEGLEKESRRLL